MNVLKANWKALVIGLGAAFVGVLLYVGGRHIANDHKLLHVVTDWAVKHDAAQRKPEPAK